MRAHYIGIKLFAVMLLVVIAYVGLVFISGLVTERQSYQHDFIRDISQSQISAQTIVSPFIRVPYQAASTCLNEKNEKYSCLEQQWIFIGAQHSEVTTRFNVTDDNYKRGIYKAISFNTQLTAQGQFLANDTKEKNYEWDKAEIVLPVQDPRGLNSKPSMKIAGNTYQFEFSPQDDSSTGFNFMRISVQQRPEIKADLQQGFDFNLSLDSNGLSSFTLIPTSQSIQYQATGNWADVKYDGQNLPFEKQSAEQQFSAQWKNIAIGQQNLARLAQCNSRDCLAGVIAVANPQAAAEAEYSNTTDKIGLTTEFLQTADVYTQTDRAIKYGIIIIFMSFACFFLFEVLKGLPIHPIQYSLVAMAQGIFFVLLLSISEYYAFALAYLLAAIACISLITWYLYFVMKSAKAAAGFGAMLSLLYAMIYLLLQSNSKTFLAGAIISFCLLAAVMFVTRHVNWYQIQNKAVQSKPELTDPLPQSQTEQ